MPVIRITGVVVNGPYLFEDVPKTYQIKHIAGEYPAQSRKCRAWLKQEDAQLFIDYEHRPISNKVYWGEVEVEEECFKTIHGTVRIYYFISKLPESKIGESP